MSGLPGPEGPCEKLAPGMYLDSNGQGVFNIADILEDVGIPDTPKNREEFGAFLREELAKRGMKARWCTHDGPTWREG